MSAAAVSATILKRFLADGSLSRPGACREFFREQARFLRIPWSLAVLRDASYDHASGTETLPKGLRKSLLQRTTWPVFNLLSGAACEDPVVEAHFTRVYNLQQPLAEMLRNPRVLLGLIWYQLKRWTRTTRLPKYADPHEPPPGKDHSAD